MAIIGRAKAREAGGSDPRLAVSGGNRTGAPRGGRQRAGQGEGLAGAEACDAVGVTHRSEGKVPS